MQQPYESDGAEHWEQRRVEACNPDPGIPVLYMCMTVLTSVMMCSLVDVMMNGCIDICHNMWPGRCINKRPL